MSFVHSPQAGLGQACGEGLRPLRYLVQKVFQAAGLQAEPGHPLGLGGVQVREDGSIVVPVDALVRELERVDEPEDVSAETQAGARWAGRPAPRKHPGGQQHSQGGAEGPGLRGRSPRATVGWWQHPGLLDLGPGAAPWKCFRKNRGPCFPAACCLRQTLPVFKAGGSRTGRWASPGVSICPLAVCVRDPDVRTGAAPGVGSGRAQSCTDALPSANTFTVRSVPS